MAAERRLTAVDTDPYVRSHGPDDRLDVLADHCIEAKKLADQVGTASMRRLADLLLFEVGRALARHEDRGGDPSRDDAA